MYCKFDHILMCVKSGVQLLCVFEAAAGDSEVVSSRQLHQRATIPEYIQTYRKTVFSSNL